MGRDEEDYVRSLRRKGVPDATIRSKLLQAGYGKEACDRLLDRPRIMGILPLVVAVVIILVVVIASLILSYSTPYGPDAKGLKHEDGSGLAPQGDHSDINSSGAGELDHDLRQLQMELDSLALDIDYMNATDYCSPISDPYMEQMCHRLTFRPHMRHYVTNSTVRYQIPGTFPACDGTHASPGTSYATPYCYFTQAAALAKDDLASARDACRRLDQEHLEGECEFYLHFNFVNFRSRPDERLSFFRSSCSEIIDEFWKVECFYLLADELSYLQDSRFLPAVKDACDNTTSILNTCYNHVTSLMGTEMTLQFCGLLEEERRTGCYQGAGAQMGYDDLEDVRNRCQLVPEEYRPACYYGYGQSITTITLNYTSSYRRCEEIDSRYLEGCYSGVSNGIFDLYHRDLDKFLLACSLVDEVYKETCYHQLGKIHVYGRSACAHVPVEYHDACMGLSDAMDLTG